MEAPTLAIPDAVVEDDAVALAEVQAGKWNMYKRRSVPRPERGPPLRGTNFEPFIIQLFGLTNKSD